MYDLTTGNTVGVARDTVVLAFVSDVVMPFAYMGCSYTVSDTQEYL